MSVIYTIQYNTRHDNEGKPNIYFTSSKITKHGLGTCPTQAYGVNDAFGQIVPLSRVSVVKSIRLDSLYIVFWRSLEELLFLCPDDRLAWFK